MDYEERIENAKKVLGSGIRLKRKGEEKRRRKGKYRKLESLVSTKNPENRKSSYYSCQRKDRYRTQGEATKHMHVLMTIRPQTKLRVYKCSYCDGWHITSKRLCEGK